MAAVTTNYGFDVPTSSDLIKNGATQIALLGQDIDTFLFRPFSKNVIANGAMDFWQRGTSFTTASIFSQYTADRWFAVRGATTGSTWTRQLTNDTTNLPDIQYCMRAARDSGNTSTTALSLSQSLENSSSTPFIGKTVTMSFYARAGANYSAASGGLVAQLKSGTGTDQKVSDGFTGSVNVINQTATLTTTWQRFSYTATVGATATQLAPVFIFIPTGTAGANDYYEITGVQLEIGSQVSPFSRAAWTIQGELALCQRYYWRATPGTSGSRFMALVGATSGTDSYGTVNNPVPMRTTPTSVDYSALNLVNAGTSTFAVTSITNSASLGTINNSGVAAFVASGLTSGQWHSIQTSSASGYIGFSAEL
jgi:hypothetical protein